MIFWARSGSDQSSISIRSEKDGAAATADVAAHPRSEINAHFLVSRIPANTTTASQHPLFAILLMGCPKWRDGGHSVSFLIGHSARY
jgi:hypothetical protein